MACPVCGSILLAIKARPLVSANLCRTCFSEWIDVRDRDGNRLSQNVTKNSRIDEAVAPVT